MKVVLALLGLFGLSLAADTCPHDLEVKCVDDINKSYKICDQAAKEKGKDLPADLECLKFLTSVEKDCWPCICFVAKTEGWKIKGCDTLLRNE